MFAGPLRHSKSGFSAPSQFYYWQLCAGKGPKISKHAYKVGKNGQVAKKKKKEKKSWIF